MEKRDYPPLRPKDPKPEPEPKKGISHEHLPLRAQRIPGGI